MCRLALFVLLASVSLIALGSPIYAADLANGKKLARKCTVCHGKLGLGRDPETPHLAGQPAFYLEKSLMDYQTGKRSDRRMSLMARPLSKEDIKDLAAWFASLKIKVIVPEK